MPIEQVDLFRTKEPDYASIWMGMRGGEEDLSETEHHVYGEQQDYRRFRHAYLHTALQIGEDWDGNVYLFNPEVVTPEGEWEAWHFGSKLGGADRWPSFWEMMQAFYPSRWQEQSEGKTAGPEEEPG